MTSDINRRSFLGFLAPLAMLPVVGPHMLLSDRPTSLGWLPTVDGELIWVDADLHWQYVGDCEWEVVDWITIDRLDDSTFLVKRPDGSVEMLTVGT